MPIDAPACFRLDRIALRPIHWLWRPHLACGKPALFDGDPGAGKSLFTARILRPDAGTGQAAPWRDGRAFWQWSDPALPHGAGRRR